MTGSCGQVRSVGVSKKCREHIVLSCAVPSDVVQSPIVRYTACCTHRSSAVAPFAALDVAAGTRQKF